MALELFITHVFSIFNWCQFSYVRVIFVCFVVFCYFLLAAVSWMLYCQYQCHWLPGKSRDVNETLAYETETFGFWSETRPRPRPSCNSTRPRRLIFATRPRPRPYKAETETFFETFNLQHCAKTMNGKPASLDVTNRSVTATAVFIIMKFIHHISIKT